MDRVGSPHCPCRADGEPMHTAERALRAGEADRTAAQNHRITTSTLISERSTPMRRARLAWSGLDGASRRRTAGRGGRAAGLAAREPPRGPYWTCRWSSAVVEWARGGHSSRGRGAPTQRSSAAPLRFAAARNRSGAPLRRCARPQRTAAAEIRSGAPLRRCARPQRTAAAGRRSGPPLRKAAAAEKRGSGFPLRTRAAAENRGSGSPPSLLDPASLLPTRLPTHP